MKRIITCACIILFLISGCVRSPAFQPVTDPTVWYSGDGFTAHPPHGKDWYLGIHNKYLLPFGKRTEAMKEQMAQSNKAPLSTFSLAVMTLKPNARKVNTPAEFPKAIEDYLVSTLNGGRFHLVSVNSKPYKSEGKESYCAQTDYLQEERDNPLFELGTVLEITEHGFICLDASSNFMIDVSYSERKPHGTKSMLDSELKQEAEDFLKDVMVRPLSQ